MCQRYEWGSWLKYSLSANREVSVESREREILKRPCVVRERPNMLQEQVC